MIVTTFVRMWLMVLVQQVVVSFQYDGLIFFVMVRRLFVFERFERAKHIRSEIRKQINGQYAIELE